MGRLSKSLLSEAEGYERMVFRASLEAALYFVRPLMVDSLRAAIGKSCLKLSASHANCSDCIANDECHCEIET